MVESRALPRRGDHFPKTKRGHGTTHPESRFDPKTRTTTRCGNPCVDQTCQRNSPRSTNEHQDQESNVGDWASEHGLSVRSKERPNAKWSTPGNAMMHATGAR